jgi:thiol-disulfide isomerase/thioredoxin
MTGPLRIALPLLLLALGCDDTATTEAAAPEGRVNAVMQSKKTPTLADLCDVTHDPASAPTFAWPQLTAAAPAASAGYRWVNVWATWCKPCIEELPMLTRVLGDWRKQGQAVELTLLSVDADPAAAQAFLTKSSTPGGSLQLADSTQNATWLTSLGLAAGSAIPVHLLVDAKGGLRCARSGGISEQDLERFRAALFP